MRVEDVEGVFKKNFSWEPEFVFTNQVRRNYDWFLVVGLMHNHQFCSHLPVTKTTREDTCQDLLVSC